MWGFYLSRIILTEYFPAGVHERLAVIHFSFGRLAGILSRIISRYMSPPGRVSTTYASG